MMALILSFKSRDSLKMAVLHCWTIAVVAAALVRGTVRIESADVPLTTKFAERDDQQAIGYVYSSGTCKGIDYKLHCCAF
jgi:hypothetical protein